MITAPSVSATPAPLLVDLALQGGEHGAFTWGVDRLLEEPWLRIEGISGTSGAMNAAVLADGYAEGGQTVPGAPRALLEAGLQRRLAEPLSAQPARHPPRPLDARHVTRFSRLRPHGARLLAVARAHDIQACLMQDTDLTVHCPPMITGKIRGN